MFNSQFSTQEAFEHLTNLNWWTMFFLTHHHAGFTEDQLQSFYNTYQFFTTFLLENTSTSNEAGQWVPKTNIAFEKGGEQ